MECGSFEEIHILLLNSVYCKFHWLEVKSGSFSLQ